MYQYTNYWLPAPDPLAAEKKAQKKFISRKVMQMSFILMLYIVFVYTLRYIFRDLGLMADLSKVIGQNMASSVMDIIYQAVTIGLPGIIGIAVMSGKFKESLPVRPIPANAMIPLLLFGMCISRLANEAASRIGNLADSFGFSTSYDSSTMGDNFFEIALKTLVIAVCPAIFEEILFRGFFLQGLRRISSDAFAIFFSALIFGIFHGNIIQIPFAFVLGLYFGWMTIYTRSILPAMILHFINNFISCAFGALSENFNYIIVNYVYSAMIIILMVAAIPAIIKFTRRERNVFEIAPNSTLLSSRDMLGASLANVPMILILVYFIGEALLLMLRNYISAFQSLF